MKRRLLLGCFLIMSAGCEAGGTGSTCPPTGRPTYDDFGRAFLQKYCTSCHATALAGADRFSAPESVNLEAHAEVKKHLQAIDATAAAGPDGAFDFMPPRLSTVQLQPTADERKRLGEWLACGAP